MPDVFKSLLLSRRCLSGDLNSPERVYHVELSLDEDFPSYEAGDVLGVYPENDSFDVELILNELNFSFDTIVLNKKKEEVSLGSFLLREANLNRCQKILLPYLKLDQNISASSVENMLFLKDKRLIEVSKYLKGISPQDLCDSLLPLLPRYYSFASSSKIDSKKAHLTVGLAVLSEQPLLYGVCTSFLCLKGECGKQEVRVFLKSSPHFHLTTESDSLPLIMVANGTGIAPFRAFLQERIKRHASSKNILFFGARHRDVDFYYENEWKEMEAKGFLKVVTAFSRDQEEKIYVQDRLRQESSLVYSLLEEGALFCVCGDARTMAKEVHKTLREIFMEKKGLSETEAEEYLKALAKNKRYLKDVY